MGRFPGAGCRRRVPGRRPAALAGLSVLALTLAGCGPASGPAPLTPDAPSTMTLSSAAFGQRLLTEHYTCHGAKVSPPLDWSGAPAGTRSYAIVLDDAAAPITPYIYWIVFNIPATTTDVLDHQLPPGARQADNSTGRPGYDAPCPRSPGQSYRFTVYALNTTLNLPDGAPTLAAWTAIARAAIARGRQTVTAKP